MSDRSQFASDGIAELLRANGLCSLDDAFHLGEVVDEQHRQRATRHENKRVVKFDLKGPSGTTPVYIKRQWRRERWIPRPTDIRHRIGLQCSPVHEWRGLRILQDAGFNVSQPLALFYRGWGFVRGAVVTRAVPPSCSMADMLLSGALQAMDIRRRDSLIEEAAGVAARLHRTRIAWRSMKAKHFYPEELSHGNWRIWLIDCEGVYRWASQRDRNREWKTFLHYFTTHTPAISEKCFRRRTGGRSGAIPLSSCSSRPHEPATVPPIGSELIRAVWRETLGATRRGECSSCLARACRRDKPLRPIA